MPRNYQHVSHFMICDACGRGPNGRQRIFVLPGRKRPARSHAEVLRWARRAGRRIGLEVRYEIEIKEPADDPHPEG